MMVNKNKQEDLEKALEILNSASYFFNKKSLSVENKKKVTSILEFYYKRPDMLKLSDVCDLEALLGENLLLIPTKKQWRKIKLDRINKSTEL